MIALKRYLTTGTGSSALSALALLFAGALLLQGVLCPIGISYPQGSEHFSALQSSMALDSGKSLPHREPAGSQHKGHLFPGGNTHCCCILDGAEILAPVQSYWGLLIPGGSLLHPPGEAILVSQSFSTSIQARAPPHPIL